MAKRKPPVFTRVSPLLQRRVTLPCGTLTEAIERLREWADSRGLQVDYRLVGYGPQTYTIHECHYTDADGARWYATAIGPGLEKAA